MRLATGTDLAHRCSANDYSAIKSWGVESGNEATLEPNSHKIISMCTYKEQR